MGDLKIAINSVGLIMTIVGVYSVYHNSPLNMSGIDGGNASTDFKAIKRQTSTRNVRLKMSVYVVIAGTILQLVSNFIASSQ